MFDDKPGSIYDFGDGIHAVVRDGQVVVEGTPPPPAQMAGRGVAPPPDPKALPDLAIKDCWYWVVLILGVCFLFGRRKAARPE